MPNFNYGLLQTETTVNHKKHNRKPTSTRTFPLDSGCFRWRRPAGELVSHLDTCAQPKMKRKLYIRSCDHSQSVLALRSRCVCLAQRKMRDVDCGLEAAQLQEVLMSWETKGTYQSGNIHQGPPASYATDCTVRLLKYDSEVTFQRYF